MQSPNWKFLPARPNKRKHFRPGHTAVDHYLFVLEQLVLLLQRKSIRTSMTKATILTCFVLRTTARAGSAVFFLSFLLDYFGMCVGGKSSILTGMKEEMRDVTVLTFSSIERTQSIYPPAPAGRDQPYDCVVSGFLWRKCSSCKGKVRCFLELCIFSLLFSSSRPHKKEKRDKRNRRRRRGVLLPLFGSRFGPIQARNLPKEVSLRVLMISRTRS